MAISKVWLQSFRNFTDRKFNFSPKVTVVIGPNGSGKTNLIESVYLVSTGKSFKVRRDEEMIAYDEELGRTKARVGDVVLETVLTRGQIGLGTANPKKVARKRLMREGVGKRLVDFASEFTTVLFGPWDMDLVSGSPSVRRRFLDSALAQVDREYRRKLLSYTKGLRQRNRLLFKIRERQASASNLLFWNKLLIKNADYILKKREEFVEFANTTTIDKDRLFQVKYDRSAISETRLKQYSREEIAAAKTLVGPHRDDLIFQMIKGPAGMARDLAKYGSRGEQRMAVLWIKLAELSFVKKETEEKPTLLLDDIFSELDRQHREMVFNVAKGQQTIITTADPYFVEGVEIQTTINL